MPAATRPHIKLQPFLSRQIARTPLQTGGVHIKLMSLGLLRAAWRPVNEVCVVRAVTRQREVLLIEQATWVQRMQKALVQMNIQLTEVLADVMGQTGQAIIRDLVAG